MTAQHVGRRVGKLAWRSTVAGLRMLIVALCLAELWHAIEPATPLAAAMLFFLAAGVLSAPVPHLLRRMRRRVAVPSTGSTRK